MSDKEYKSIKVKGEVYEDLKRMGKGIGKAVEILVESQKQEVERKIDDVRGLGEDIAAIMLKQGIFDIKFAGAGVQEVIEDGDTLRIRGFVNIVIANEDARAKIIEVLRGKEEKEDGET